MKHSIRHCAFVISALLIGVSAIDLNTPAQAQSIQQIIDETKRQNKIEAARRAKQAQQARPTRQRHDYLGAWNLAYSAINKCYSQKNLDECSKLNQIKNTLLGWCYDKDRDSCILYKEVNKFEDVVQQAETLN